MKQFLITLGAVFVALLLFFVGLPVLFAASLVSAARPAPETGRTILSLDLREALTDQEPASPLAFLQGHGLSVLGVVDALRRAEADDRVHGLLVRVPQRGVAPAAADEIGDAIRRFRAKKPVIAFTQGIYPEGISTSAYMLGAAAGRLWMQPAASLQSVGVGVEEAFFKRAFDKYGVKAEFEQRAEYKNAVNPFLQEDFTPAHREAELSFLGSIYEREIAAAAADRRLAPGDLKTRLENGPYAAEEALSQGLVDRIAQEREAEESLLRPAGGDAKLRDFAAYAGARPTTPAAAGPKIALIAGEGEILAGTSRGAGLSSKTAIYSDDLAKAFYDAAADPAVKAIVFRVSSPGGGIEASEQILSAVKAAQAAGKPVVVSMGAYAASGGYWISSHADEIVAQPTTLTGSIGIFGGKFVLGPALARFGVDLRDLTIGGDYAGGFGSAAGFTPAQRRKFAAWIDHGYADFIQRVAEGRKLAPDRVREIARGRVWTGEQAKSLGLVDRLGGLDVALAEARRLARLGPGDGQLVAYPAHPGPLEALQRALGLGARSATALGALAAVLGDERVAALIGVMARAEGPPAAGLALAPGLPVR